MKNCLIDLDGTIYRGDVPISYADTFIEHLSRTGRKYLFVTNCPLHSPSRIAEKLAGMGIDASGGRVLNSGMVAMNYILERHAGSRVFAIGSPDFLELLSGGGIDLSPEEPDIVLVGFDPDFTYAKMEAACDFILHGALFFGTNRDATIPRGERTVPHTGALLASITAATGKDPLCFGKPSRLMLDAALKIMDCAAEECAVVGDRMDTDIQWAISGGIPGYLVLTGSSSRETIENSAIRPTLAVGDLRELVEIDEQGGL